MDASFFVIPKETPFELTAIATDEDEDDLSYCWEQKDDGNPVSLGNQNTDGPLFRSLDPSDSPTRVFPRLQDLVQNIETDEEVLPELTRTMNFVCTVRDNAPLAGLTAEVSVLVDVEASAGPFRVLVPNINGITWQGNTMQTVLWEKASTTAPPVSCTKVDIYLSEDGGFTYPYLIAENTPNDGTQEVLIPNINTTQARIKVKGDENIFFDISNTNFTITPSTSVENIGPEEALKLYPNPSQGMLNLEFVNLNPGEYNVALYDAKGRRVLYATKTGSFNALDLNSVPAGVYTIKLQGEDWSHVTKWIRI